MHIEKKIFKTLKKKIKNPNGIFKISIKTNKKRKYSKEQLIKMLQYKAKELGRIPKTTDTKQMTPIRKNFGNLDNTLKKAGLIKNLRKTKINIENLTNYELGIIWSIGSYISSEKENSFILRHKNKYFLKQIQKYTDSKIQVQKSNTGIQYKLKTNLIDIEQLQRFNYIARNDDNRQLPILENYKDFLRAYIEIHGAWGWATTYTRKKEKYYRCRLRIFGNIDLLEQLNNIISTECSVIFKKVQKVHNNKTGYIVYTSLEELEKITNYIKGKPYFEEFWKKTEEFLSYPRKYV